MQHVEMAGRVVACHIFGLAFDTAYVVVLTPGEGTIDPFDPDPDVSAEIRLFFLVHLAGIMAASRAANAAPGAIANSYADRVYALLRLMRITHDEPVPGVYDDFSSRIEKLLQEDGVLRLIKRVAHLIANADYGLADPSGTADALQKLLADLPGQPRRPLSADASAFVQLNRQLW
jgi:hypothetical protein